MHLLADIAYTHIRGRGRQTLVSIAGVTLGVGFAIGMAALMQGSQDEFVGTRIDAMPHVQVTDEQRTPPVQPAERAFDAVAFEADAIEVGQHLPTWTTCDVLLEGNSFEVVRVDAELLSA